MQDDGIEQRVRAAAGATGVAFEIFACDPELADTAAFCEAYGVAMEDSANCVMEPARVVLGGEVVAGLATPAA